MIDLIFFVKFTEKIVAMFTEKTLQYSFDLIFDTDKDGFVNQINTAFSECLGYTSAEIKGKTIYNFINTQNSGFFINILNLTEVLFNEKIIFISKSGKHITAKCNSFLFSETIRRFICKPVNEIKDKVEISFNHKSITDDRKIKVFAKDKSSAYISCNEAFAAEHNLKPDNIIGKTDFDLFDEKLAEKFYEDDQMYMKENKTENFIENYNSNGKNIWIQTIKSPLLNKNGEVYGLFGITWDITNDFKNNKKYEQALKTSIDGFAIIDKNGSFIETNNAFSKLFEYSSNELKKMNIKDLNINPNSEKLIKNFTSVKQHSKYIFDHQFISKTGKIIDVSFSATYDAEYDLIFVFIKDITTEVKERNLLLKFKNAVDNSYDAIAIADINGKHLYNNRSYEKCFGYTIDDLKGKSPVQIFENKQLAKTIFDNLKNNKTWNGTAAIVAKNGKKIEVEISSSTITNKNNEIIGMFGIHKDISERINYEKELETNLKKLLSIFNGIDDIIYISDLGTYEILHVNNTVEKILGRSVLGEKCYKVFQNSSKPCSFCTNSIIKKQKEDETYKWEYFNKITNRWYQCADKTIDWVNGKKVRFELALDITEIKDVQQKLVQSEEKFKSIFENSIIGISVTNIDGTFMPNEAFANILGYTIKELQNIPWEKITHPDDIQVSKDVVANFLSGKMDSQKFTKRYIHKSGRHVWTQVYTAVYRKNNKPEYFITALNDITVKKSMEMELINYTNKLKKSNEELEQFAYVASHDLQEPLRMVSSFTQLLEKKYKNQLDEKANMYIHFAVDGANRMQVLINDLLEFSRISTRGEKFIIQDINKIVEEACENIKNFIDEKNALVKFDLLPEMYVDKTQILRLFQNLIVNGIKYNKNKQPEINISAEEKTNEWIIKIKDNGIGIEEKHFDKIFVIFQRLHSKNEYSGTGIGLSICKKIVERHGGDIWVESTPHIGSSFFFSILKKS